MGRIKELLGSRWFSDNFPSLRITFWGGEPSLQLDSVRKVIETFAAVDGLELVEVKL